MAYTLFAFFLYLKNRIKSIKYNKNNNNKFPSNFFN